MAQQIKPIRNKFSLIRPDSIHLHRDQVRKTIRFDLWATIIGHLWSMEEK